MVFCLLQERPLQTRKRRARVALNGEHATRGDGRAVVDGNRNSNFDAPLPICETRGARDVRPASKAAAGNSARANTEAGIGTRFNAARCTQQSQK
jgi:hypothetical protein